MRCQSSDPLHHACFAIAFKVNFAVWLPLNGYRNDWGTCGAEVRARSSSPLRPALGLSTWMQLESKTTTNCLAGALIDFRGNGEIDAADPNPNPNPGRSPNCESGKSAAERSGVRLKIPLCISLFLSIYISISISVSFSFPFSPSALGAPKRRKNTCKRTKHF